MRLISRSDSFFQVLLSSTIFISTMCTYFLSRRLLSAATHNTLLRNALAVYVAIYSMHLMATGMEILLTIPILLYVAVCYQDPRLWLPTFSRSFCFGLLLSALFLSRLDTAILLTVLALATAVHPILRRRCGAIQMAGLLSGLIPSLLYLASNRYFFGVWLPISGMAKQLKPNFLPTLPAWQSVFNRGPVALAGILMTILALWLIPLIYLKLSPAQQVLYPVLLSFPFLYVLLLSCRSDWQLWDWYLYCFRVSMCIAFVVFLTFPITRRLLHNTATTAFLACFFLFQIVHNSRAWASSGGSQIYESAVHINSFMSDHPGIYAMGDRAGMVGYLTSTPVIQTEGLVMDREFLSFIRRQAPLDEVFSRYHVHYYVATGRRSASGCFHAVEPLQAGPTSPHMTMDLCQAPLATFTDGVFETLIYNVRPEALKSEETSHVWPLLPGWR